MRKRVKKLVVHRETLRQLDQLTLEQIDGGTGDATVTCPERCTWSGRNTCNSCELTCTTNFC